jgi:hypothetical protein
MRQEDADDVSRLSLRSIPPVSTSGRAPLPHEKGGASGVWAIATLCLAGAVPFVGHRLASASEDSAAAARAVHADDVDVGLRTAVVREAALASTPVAFQGRTGVTVVPRNAIAHVDGKPVVYVADGDLRLIVATPVELGAFEGPEQRVLSGVSAGQVVVVEGFSQLEPRGARKY